MDAKPARPSLSDRVPDDAGIDLPQALQRLGNDFELLHELAQIFVEDAPGFLANAARGLDPTQLEESARSAHSLKGLASNFSAAAADAAQAAEQAIRNGDRASIQNALATLKMYMERLAAELQRSVLQETRVDHRESSAQ